MTFTVYASTKSGDITVTNGNGCCAERRLLHILEFEIKTHSKQKSKTKLRQALLRKTGGIIRVWRISRDVNGNEYYGNCAPCKFCSIALIKRGLRVHCYLENGEEFMGCPSELSVHLTSGQRRFFNVQRFPLNIHT